MKRKRMEARKTARPVVSGRWMKERKVVEKFPPPENENRQDNNVLVAIEKAKKSYNKFSLVY